MNSNFRLAAFVMLGLFASPMVQAQTTKSLFDFSQSSDASQWQIVNDGVMGGRSTSQAKMVQTPSGESVMQFTGNLSLANNGGFASVRSRPRGSLGLRSGQTIVMRVKGDGRRYTFNLYTPDRRTAFSYQLRFDTRAGEWVEVRLPVNQFAAHSFGRRVSNMPLTPSRVHSVGILLGDKNPGAFQLMVDWINVQ